MSGNDWSKIGWAGGLGFFLVISTFLGLGIGLFFDSTFKTSPIFTIAFFLLGTAAGFYNIFNSVKKDGK